MNSCKLSDITKCIFDGKHGGCEEVKDSGYYFISVKDLDEFEINYDNAKQISKEDFDEIYKRTKLEIGDTIYANSGDTIGKSIYISTEKYVNNTAFQKSVAVLKPNNKVDSRFLYYLLKNETKKLRKKATGSAQKNLLLDTMRNYVVNIPDINKQIMISSILGNIDNIIHNNIKTNKKIEQFLFLIYKNIDYEKILCKKILLKDFVSFMSGYPFSTESYSKSGKYKLYTIKNVQDGKVIAKVDNYIEKLPNNLPDYCELKKGDLIMSLTGNVGRVGIVYDENTLLNQRLVKIGDSKNRVFNYIMFRDQTIKTRIEKLSHGTSQKNVSPIDIGNLEIVIPNDEYLNKFNEKYDIFLSIIISNLEENLKLEELRNFLLPYLMSEKIKKAD